MISPYLAKFCRTCSCEIMEMSGDILDKGYCCVVVCVVVVVVVIDLRNNHKGISWRPSFFIRDFDLGPAHFPFRLQIGALISRISPEIRRMRLLRRFQESAIPR